MHFLIIKCRFQGEFVGFVTMSNYFKFLVHTILCEMSCCLVKKIVPCCYACTTNVHISPIKYIFLFFSAKILIAILNTAN